MQLGKVVSFQRCGYFIGAFEVWRKTWLEQTCLSVIGPTCKGGFSRIHIALMLAMQEVIGQKLRFKMLRPTG